MKRSNFKSNDGVTLVEVVIATAIILIFVLSIFAANSLYLKSAIMNTSSVQATLLAEEGIEAVKFLRNSSWSDNIAPEISGTSYSLVLQSGSWQITNTNIFIDGIFERHIVFSDVYRDVNGDIVTSGGSLDNNTRLVTSSVSWRKGAATTTKSISAYITNILNN